MKILVVDREEDLGAALDILEKTPGNEIQSARTGEEALEITEGQEVDLLITEVFLEPMNGFTLRNKMENRHSGVRTIFLSGYDLSPYAEHTEGYEIIAKPATPQKLFPAIARAMAGNGGVEAPAPAPDFASRPPVAAPKAAPSARGPALKPLSTAPAAPPPALAPHPVPMATPAGLPKAVPAARPAAQAPAAAADPLTGKQLGNYRIERRLGNGKWGPVYLANQTSMNRPVAMELLAAEMVGDEVARQNFVATARAKAAVQHPHILSVYEADQAEGYYFYTHEYVDGLTLAEMAARGEGLSEQTALQTVKAVAQGLAHLQHSQIAHAIPDATDIFVGSDGLPYLSNVAQPGKEMPSVQEEICALGEVIRTVLPGGHAQEPGLRAMLTRMGITNQMGFQSWPSLFQAIQAIEPKVVPVDAFKLSAQDEAAIRAVEEARKRQRRVVAGSVAGLVVFLCILGAAIWWEFLRPTSHDFSDEMVKVEAGDFIYQDGQKLSLPTFYIDKYEVTIAEYAKFLQYVSDHDNSTDFDSPLQPRGRTHVPENWDIYYNRASYPLSEGRTFKGVPITLDCPVFNVDYFDAYAYAKWKGRRLPTQQEWEKAARGPTGLIYPWGNTWDPGKLNSGADYQAHPAPDYKPAVDGFTWWAPVNAIMTDRSPYGAIGMAGNVSEWTDSWDPSRTYVYIRGGNFKSDAAAAMNTAQIKTYPQEYAESLGFRTASDHPPAKQ